MEFSGISNGIQSGRLFRGEIQEIPSKVLLTFWGGLLIRTWHYSIVTCIHHDTSCNPRLASPLYFLYSKLGDSSSWDRISLWNISTNDQVAWHQRNTPQPRCIAPGAIMWRDSGAFRRDSMQLKNRPTLSGFSLKTPLKPFHASRWNPFTSNQFISMKSPWISHGCWWNPHFDPSTITNHWKEWHQLWASHNEVTPKRQWMMVSQEIIPKMVAFHPRNDLNYS